VRLYIDFDDDDDNDALEFVFFFFFFFLLRFLSSEYKSEIWAYIVECEKLKLEWIFSN
jgi:hypothetical protein